MQQTATECNKRNKCNNKKNLKNLKKFKATTKTKSATNATNATNATKIATDATKCVTIHFGIVTPFATKDRDTFCQMQQNATECNRMQQNATDATNRILKQLSQQNVSRSQAQKQL